MEASSMLPRFRAMKGNPGRSHAVRFSAALMLAATAGGIAPATWAQTLTADQVLSSISLSVVAAQIRSAGQIIAFIWPTS